MSISHDGCIQALRDLYRYKSVVEKLIEWDLQCPRPRAAGVEELIEAATKAVVQEGT